MIDDDAIDEEEIMDALFFAGLHGIRDVEFKTIREWVESGGHKIIDSPTDEELPAALAALIDALASVNVFARFTDHLSDRELYEYLVDKERLGAHMALLPNNFIFLDVLGGGSADDHELYLRYYATASEREEERQLNPGGTLPDHEPCPYERDRSLP